MSVTFSVSSVRAESELLPTREASGLLQQRGLHGVEASSIASRLVECEPYHGFVMAVHTAYDKHYPLVLSPDHIWLLIAQGLARHINENAEALRGRFVRHQGKLDLKVRRDEFRPKDPNNDWPGVFTELSDQIKEHVGNRRDLFLCNFSTTDFVARASSEVVLLGAMQQYFTYTVMSLCGIPSITLLGTTSDWKNIQQRVEALAEFDLQWWVDALRPIIAQFEAASRDEIDKGFWSEIYKLEGGSGGPYVSGWINTFFPYLGDSGNTRNKKFLAAEAPPEPPKGFFQKLFSAKESKPAMSMPHHGPRVSEFPCGITQAPFKWKFLHHEQDMSFAAGFIGVSQDADGSIRPQLGWAVTEALGSTDFSVQIMGDKFQISPKKGATNLEGIAAVTKSMSSVLVNIWFSDSLVSFSGLDGAKNISEIRVLNASKLHDLSALREIPYLASLSIQQCDAVTSIEIIAQLQELQELGISHCTNIKDLSPICKLSKLKRLDLFGKTIPAAIQGRHQTPEDIQRVQQLIGSQ
jgi:hypothetical protein